MLVTVMVRNECAPYGYNMMSYITERSATTHIAVHPELRLVV